MSPLADDPAGSAVPRAPGLARAILILAHLTFAEARRRRILAAALILGSAFVALFAVGLHLIALDVRAKVPLRQQPMVLSFVVMAALYASNFLIVMTSVLVAVDTLAGEIGSGVVETLCTKPVSRAAIALGKWLGCWILLVVYASVLCGGGLLLAPPLGGYTPPKPPRGPAPLPPGAAGPLSPAPPGGAPPPPR